jgi:hypothetical protein
MECERIAGDTSKSVFTLHGVDERGRAILRRDLVQSRSRRFVVSGRIATASVDAGIVPVDQVLGVEIAQPHRGRQSPRRRSVMMAWTGIT